MKTFWALFKRELFALFVTPLAWVLLLVFLVVQGMHFYLLVDHFTTTLDVTSEENPLSSFFGNTVILYLVLFLLLPPMTMRLFAEERRTGTLENLMTAPVSAAAVVLSKFFATLVLYVTMWLPTSLYLLILKRAGDMDMHVAGTSYLGVFLVGAGYLSVGLLMSSFTESQFLAMVLTALVILVFFILGIGEFVTPEGSTLHAFCSYVSVWSTMGDFGSGIVDSRRLAFGATLVVLPIFLCIRTVDSWRWS